MANFILDPNIDMSTVAGSRAVRYPELFEAFISSPLFGDASYNSNFDYFISIGGHLHWMSRLTVWGIFGFWFYVYTLRRIFKKVFSFFDQVFSIYYLISVIAFIMLGLLKVVAGRENWIVLFVVIPGLYFLGKTGNKKFKAVTTVENYSHEI